MLLPRDKATIEEIARRYGVGRVLLFGSSATDQSEAHDIDLAVEGLAASRFFSFYAELMFGLSKPVDLVDLARKSRFTEMIRRDGVTVYG